MFQTEVREDRSFAAFALQQLGVCFAGGVWGLISTAIPFWLSRFGLSGNALEVFSIVVLGALPAFVCGFLIRRQFPHFAAAGRWIWFLPSSLLVVALASSAFNARLVHDLSDFFFPGPEWEGWWAVWFFTYPALGCVGYSLGVRFQKTR